LFDVKHLWKWEAVNFRNLERKLLDSPFSKALFNVCLLILSGVLTNAYISEINTPSGIDWMKTFHVWISLLLAMFSAFAFLFYYRNYLWETDIEKFKDDKYCEAYIKRHCLGEVVEKFNAQIKKGDFSGFREMKDMLKGRGR